MDSYYFSHEIHPLKNYYFKLSIEYFNALMQNFGYDFFICEGAALGAYRNKNPIPWDNDIDVGIFAENYNEKKFDKIFCNDCIVRKIQDKKIAINWLNSRLNCDAYFNIKKKITTNGQPEGYFFNCHIPAETLYYETLIDIYIVYQEKESLIDRYILESPWRHDRIIRGFKNLQFCAGFYSAPSNIEEYLSMCYGPDFMQEDKSWRPSASHKNTHENRMK